MKYNPSAATNSDRSMVQYTPSPTPPQLQPCWSTQSHHLASSLKHTPSLPDISQLGIGCASSPHPHDQPQTSYRFPDDTPSPSDTSSAENIRLPPSRFHSYQNIAHPYARIYAKKDNQKRARKIWAHALEKDIFTTDELYVAVSFSDLT